MARMKNFPRLPLSEASVYVHLISDDVIHFAYFPVSLRRLLRGVAVITAEEGPDIAGRFK